MPQTLVILLLLGMILLVLVLQQEEYFAAGNLDFSNATNVMDYVTFSSLGNATDFGDRTVSYNNSTRT